MEFSRQHGGRERPRAPEPSPAQQPPPAQRVAMPRLAVAHAECGDNAMAECRSESRGPGLGQGRARGAGSLHR